MAVQQVWSLERVDDFVYLYQVYLEDGVDLSGDIWLEVASVSWVAAAMRRCLVSRGAYEFRLGEDDLTVDPLGPDWSPKVGISNERAESAPHPGFGSVTFPVEDAPAVCDALEGLTA